MTKRICCVSLLFCLIVISLWRCTKQSDADYAEYRDITKDLTNIIVKILQTSDNATFENSSENWNFYEYEAAVEVEVKNRQNESIQHLVFNTSKIETSVPRLGITCNFHHNMQVNTFKYEKVEVLGNFAFKYKSSNDFISREGFANVHIENVEIPTILISIEKISEASLLHNMSMTYKDFTTVILLKNDNRLAREKRIVLGNLLPNSLINKINNQIKNTLKTSIQPIHSICKESWKIIKRSYLKFDQDPQENNYYFGIDRGWIDTAKLISRSQVIDVFIQGLLNIKSVHVSHPYRINGEIIHELQMENLKGNLIWVQHSTELTDLSFEIDFIFLTVKKSKNKIKEVRIKAANFSVVPVTSNISPLTGDQRAHIKKEFESLAAAFLYERISGDSTTRFKNDQLSNSTFELFNSPNNSSHQQSQFYLFDKYNVGPSLASAIVQILQNFHSDVMQSIIRNYEDKNIENQGRFSHLKMSATIINVKEEICNFTNVIEVKFYGVSIELKGIILGSNDEKSHGPESKNIPFIVNIINSLAVSRQRDSTECSANIGDNDERVFLNSTTYPYKKNEKKDIKSKIFNILKSEICKMENYTEKFSYDICMDLKTTIKFLQDGKGIDDYSKYHFGVMNNLIDTTFHIPVKVNEIKVYGLWNFVSINTTRVNDGTIFQFVIKNLFLKISWYYYTGGSYLTKPEEMNFKADFIKLTGKINENGTQLEFTDDSRLILIITGRSIPPNKLITIERVKNKINQTIISAIQHSIKESYIDKMINL